MTNGWIELPTLVSVCNAQTDGWEIEIYDTFNEEWEKWVESSWHVFMKYRGRPRQPKKVKMLCYLDHGGELRWVRGKPARSDWIRVPEQDIEIEIPEGV